MSAPQPLHLVVIDDSVRFAFHVWRYLGRGIGIGAGAHGLREQIPDKELAGNFWREESRNESHPEPLKTGSGLIQVWWVPGDDSLRKKLRMVLERIGSGERFFLVDMRGQPGGGLKIRKRRQGTNLGPDGEGLGEQALRLIARDAPQDLGDDSLMVVSSYETGMARVPGDGVRRLRIWPKSPDTLAQIASRVRKKLDLRKVSALQGASTPPLASSALHVLVTGAGFEIRNDRTGSFGLPKTGELLSEIGSPFGRDHLRFKRWRNRSFLPCIQGYKELDDLDAWWNQVLEKELWSRLSKHQLLDRSELREQEKTAASIREREMREAFRRVILKYDDGYMNQSLDAAELPWHTWLTTNYTRFADRAIASVERHRKCESPWQVVSTSIEALSLEREVLHGPQDPERSPRHLFKLHGDIAHLQTMATAGYDKELFSMLSVPVDSLHQVYAAADVVLRHSLQRHKARRRLVWHIVGHGLNDWLLLRLIGQACRHAASGTRNSKPDFVVVGPKPENISRQLCEFLEQNLEMSFAEHIVWCKATAEEYLARIRSLGGLPEPGARGWISHWPVQLGLDGGLVGTS
jgi:hypothetical protein